MFVLGVPVRVDSGADSAIDRYADDVVEPVE